MKASVERNVLLKAMSQAQSIVERRNAIPILSNVLLTASSEGLSVRATDGDIDILESVKAEVSQEGGTTASAHYLHDVVRKLPQGSLVQLSDDGAEGRLEVKAGRSQFRLFTLPREDFPQFDDSEYPCTFSIAGKALKALFDKSKFAISTEETRYYLNGVNMHSAESDGEKVFRCVATDGHKLARVDAPLPSGADGMPNVIVPRKTVLELLRLLEGLDGDIEVSVSDSKVRFKTEDVTLVSKLVDGTFPDYQHVIPTDNKLRMEVDAREFMVAVDRMATLASERSNALKFAIEDDRMEISVNSQEGGAGQEELAVTYKDTKLEVGFNAKYLLEIAALVEKGNAIMLLSSTNGPTLVRAEDDESAVYVVMPMRV